MNPNIYSRITVGTLKATKYIKQILTDLKGELDSNMKIVQDFTTPLTSMERSPKQKINKKNISLK